jgi:hypothetical protein
MNEAIKSLQSLIGINTKEAFNYLVSKRFMENSTFNDKTRGRTVENIIALLLNRNLPGSYKGSDFIEFEIKTIQIQYTKRDKLIRTCGDTPISKFENEPNFDTSNIWDKLKSVLSVLVYEDTIVDVLYFNGEQHKAQLKSDYQNLFLGENNFFRKDNKTWREVEGKNNKYLARKDYKSSLSSVMMMGNKMIDLSQSVSVTPNVVIDNQVDYLETILGDKILNYKKQYKKSGLDIIEKIAMISDVEELLKYRDFITQMIINKAKN